MILQYLNSKIVTSYDFAKYLYNHKIVRLVGSDKIVKSWLIFAAPYVSCIGKCIQFK